jgi:hypothetical protein
MAILSIEQILAADDIPSEVVQVPEWGGEVKVRGLSRAAFDAITKAAEVIIPATGPGQQPTTGRDDDKFAEHLFLACVIEPKFSEEHLELLKDKSVAALNRVYEAIGRVLQTDVNAAKKD